MFTSDIEMRSGGPVLRYAHNEVFETRTTRVTPGMPYEILLGVLCYGYTNHEQAADYFAGFAERHPNVAIPYLLGFFRRLSSELQIYDGAMRAKPEFRFLPMDFERPSPTRGMLWIFVARLCCNRALLDAISELPDADFYLTDVRPRTRNA